MSNYQHVPQELKNTPQWVCWINKIPKNPHNGINAKSNDPATWGTFEQALKAQKEYKFSGIGFMFSEPYFGVDLDKCVDQIDFIDEFVDTLQSYTEYSPSGSGIHIICKGTLPPGARKKGNVEMYSSGRFFTVTGNI
ncbi:MAG: DNA primase, partial [Chloroflexi bacterium]|nr:DNA primase [Chloroflexota bacterium]